MPSLPLSGAGPSAGAADPYADYLVYDTYTDDNATDLADHIPDKDTEGGGWTTEAKKWTVVSNRASPPSDAGEYLAWIDSGQANVRAVCGTLYLSDKHIGPIVRLSDSANYFFGIPHVTGDELRIYKTENGGYADLGSYSETVDAPSTWTNFELKCDGTSLKLYDDGTERVSITNAFNQTETNIGLWDNASDGNGYVDNLAVEAV